MMETVLNIGRQRRLREGPGQAGRQRAVRLGLLPAADPDVRQDRARHRGRRSSRTPSTTAKQAKGTTNDLDLDADDLQALVDAVQGRSSRRRPAGTSRRTRASSSTWPSRAVFDSWNTERAVLYRRQERIPADLGTAVNIVRDGLRQPRPRTPAPAWPSPATRPAASRASTATTCRTPRARTSSPASATRCRCTTWSRSTRSRYDELMQIMADAGAALQGPVRHRVHDRARQAVDAADPGRQAHRRRRRSGSPPSWSTRA